MTEPNRAICSELSMEGAFRVGQGFWFIAGGLFAVVSVWQTTILGKIPTAELAVVTFALGFVADGAAAYLAGRTRRAGLSLLAAVAFVLLITVPSKAELVGATALFLNGCLLLVDSLAANGWMGYLSAD